MAKLTPLRGLLGLVVSIAAVAGYVAYRTRRVPTPHRRWHRFQRRGNKEVTAAGCKRLEGFYTIISGADFFGETAVAKYSYTVEYGRTLHHLSFFCHKNGLYIVCQGRQQGEFILLQGHWRKAAANGAGLVWLWLKQTTSEAKSNWTITGAFGSGNQKPEKPIAFCYNAPLPQTQPFEIIGHRGAARNVDFLPVSENSLASIKMAARIGATGVEIDVRTTKDGVPIVFHDSFLSVHTTRGGLYGGLVHNYTLRQLKRVTLRKGGRIPTLKECLQTALYKTPLQTIWLDVKGECNLQPVQQLQQQYLQEAAAMGRNFSIYIGIPSQAVMDCFKKLENYQQVPSLIELAPDVALEIGAEVWAPQYTGGFQRQNVEKMQAAGRKAFVWSLDSEFMINLFINKGGFDGLVTNTPAVVAHWFYMQQRKVINKASQPA